MVRVGGGGVGYLIGTWISGASVALIMAHYGIPITAPLPSPALFFWPLFGCFMTAAQATTGGLSLAVLWWADRWGREEVES